MHIKSFYERKYQNEVNHTQNTLLGPEQIFLGATSILMVNNSR